jgi:putative hydrolase of the HAD superfamily
METGVIRAVFFDAGGTLLHTAEPVGVTYAHFTERYGWRADAEKTEKGFRSAWNQRRIEGMGSDAVLGRDGWRKIVEFSLQTAGMPAGFPVEDYFHEVYEHFARPDAWRAFPEAEGVLLDLKKRGLKMGVLSNWDSRLRKVLQGFDWSEYFDLILISEELGSEKPDSAIFRMAEKQGALRPGECALIGDDPISDRGGAEQAGWKWALVDRPRCGLGEALAGLSL